VESALRGYAYHRADVQLSAATHIDPSTSPFGGNRAVFAIIDLASGHLEAWVGSYGGPQLFAPTALDTARGEVPVPVGCVVLRGETGGRGAFFHLYAHPETLTALLPAPTADVTPEERKTLAVFRGIKSSHRAQYLRGLTHLVDGLVARGYLKRNKAGATQITTQGKNACEGVQPY
jgi:hypothetical protein